MANLHHSVGQKPAVNTPRMNQIASIWDVPATLLWKMSLLFESTHHYCSQPFNVRCLVSCRLSTSFDADKLWRSRWYHNEKLNLSSVQLCSGHQKLHLMHVFISPKPTLLGNHIWNCHSTRMTFVRGQRTVANCSGVLSPVLTSNNLFERRPTRFQPWHMYFHISGSDLS